MSICRSICRRKRGRRTGSARTRKMRLSTDLLAAKEFGPCRHHRSERAGLGPRARGAAADQRALGRQGRVRGGLLLGPVPRYRAEKLDRGNSRRHDRGGRSRAPTAPTCAAASSRSAPRRSRTSPPSGCSRRRPPPRARPARRSLRIRRTPARRPGIYACWKAPAWTCRTPSSATWARPRTCPSWSRLGAAAPSWASTR